MPEIFWVNLWSTFKRNLSYFPETLVLPKNTIYGGNVNQENTSTKFNDSFERCINDPFFLDKFYEVFLSSSDEVYQKFKNTDMETQKVMLMTSLVYMSRAHSDSPGLLSTIADKHNKNNLNIKPHLYVLWLDSLIVAANSIDPLFDNSTETLWRETLQPGIDLMISRYGEI